MKKIIAIFLVFTVIPLCALIFEKKENSDFAVFDTVSGKKISLSEKEYVLGALCSEMPPTFAAEALKAQAVAIYTNAVRARAEGKEYVANVDVKNHSGYMSEGELKSFYGKNFEPYYSKMKDAVNETFGKVITYNGKPILAAYHSCSPGMTESSENVWGQPLEYLSAASSEGDTFCSECEMTEKMSEEAAKALVFEKYESFDGNLTFSNYVYSDSGTVLSVNLGNLKLTGQKVREIFSLRSACFSVNKTDGEIEFITKGYGHGVGLSQYGADFMARQGENWRQILKHYYKNVKIMEYKQ